MNYKGYKIKIVRDKASPKFWIDSNGMARSKLQTILHCDIMLGDKSLGYEMTIRDAKIRIAEAVRLLG